MGLNRRLKLKNVVSTGGEWKLSGGGKDAFTICQKTRPNPPQGDPTKCWVAETDEFDQLLYVGNVNVTESGERCARWNDQSYRTKGIGIPHKWLNRTTHNYCRRPGMAD